MLFDLFSRGESRSLENPSRSVTDAANWFNATPASVVPVNETAALGVPAIWQAINLLSSTIANLPLHLYRVDKSGEVEKATNDPLYYIVHDRMNDVHTKSQFFKWWIWRALASEKGRGIALIMRNKADRVMGFAPLDERATTVRQYIDGDGKLTRTYTVGTKTYDSREIIDLAPVMAANGFDAISPIISNASAVGAIIAAEKYATEMFANGGVPPLTYTAPPTATSPEAAARAVEQMSSILKLARDSKRNIVPVQAGGELAPLGFEPAKQQMIELRTFQIQEVARIYNVAPALLYDLSTGTYANYEQQSLSFATQTILPLVKMIEQELNLKLFGKRNSVNYVEFNMDGLVRGDIKSRMEALRAGINSGLRTPNEARALDNLPALPGGDELYIQSATVPLTMAGKTGTAPAPANDPTDEDGNPKEPEA